MDAQTIRDLHDLRDCLMEDISRIRADDDDAPADSTRYDLRDRERWIAAIDAALRHP